MRSLPFLLTASGLEELRNGATPSVGSDYMLRVVDDFQYDLSFMVHISQGVLFIFYSTLQVLASKGQFTSNDRERESANSLITPIFT